MRAEDILKESEIGEDDCGVCELHEKAYKVLKIECPYCKKPLERFIASKDVDLIQYDNLVVVGETNYYSPDQILEMMPIISCEHCDEDIGLKPIPVQYNANHDIHYTGGKDYIITEEIGLTDKMKASIEQFTERVKAGEDLDAWNLQLWLARDMEKEIARILTEKGLKL